MASVGELEIEIEEEVKRVECGCCGIMEDCTMDYICWVQQRYGGVWVCGLCEEAIKDEQIRLGGVGVEVALRVHTLFRETTYNNIITNNNSDEPTLHITRSLVQLIKKIISSSSSSSSSSCVT
ncbi:hypothetical protein ACFE04_006323 [Oxalis oulophora]